MEEITEKSNLQNPDNFNISLTKEAKGNNTPKNINQNQNQYDICKDKIDNSPANNNPNANDKQSSNLYYTSNIKKSCHKSITLDSKIIKNLNEQNFINNTCIKNPKRNSKNISSGIRKMLKILKLDDENCNEETDGENSSENSGNIKTTKIKNTNRNINENKSKNINEKIKEENEINLENNNNSNNNKKEEKCENKSNDLNEPKESNINSKEIKEVKDSNISNKNYTLNISNINSIEILKNNIEHKNDSKVAYIVSNENSINLTQNKMTKDLKLVIEKNNFELNISNKKKNVSENKINKTEYQICNQFITSIGNIKNIYQINNEQSKENDNNNLENNLTIIIDKAKTFEIKNINNFSFIHEKINDNTNLKKFYYQINKIENINFQHLSHFEEQGNIVDKKKCLNNNNHLKNVNQENNENKISYQINNTDNAIINENKKDKSFRKKKQNLFCINKNENFDNLILDNKENICFNNNNNVFSICNRNQFEYDIDNDDNKNIYQNNHVIKFIKKKKNGIFNDFLKSESNNKYKYLLKEKIKIKNNSTKKRKTLNRSAELINLPSMNFNHIKSNDKCSKNIKYSYNGKKFIIKYKNTSETKNRSSSKNDIYQRNIKLKTYSAYGNTDALKKNNHLIKKKFLHYLSSKNSYSNFNTQKGKVQNFYRNMSSLNNKNIINISNISNTNKNCDISIDMHPNYIKSNDIKSTSDESNNININNNKYITNVSGKNKISHIKKKIKRSSSIKEYINNYNMNKINSILNNSKTNYNNSKDNQKNTKRLMNNRRSVQNIKNEIKMKLINNANDVSNTIIRDYRGPIDIKYISLKNYEMTIKNLIKRIKMLKYKYVIIDFNLYKCIRGTKIMYIEVVKIKKNLYYYLITRDKKNLKHKKNI